MNIATDILTDILKQNKINEKPERAWRFLIFSVLAAVVDAAAGDYFRFSLLQ